MHNKGMDTISEESLKKHKELHGKIAIRLKDTLDSREKLNIYYTPGVGAVSSYVAEHKDETREYTWTKNLVAVISDGSAVLGLGDIGPQGALPVMEGKAMLFKSFGNIDAVPIVLDVHTPDEIVATVKAIAPSFGAINLEDIAAPQCFEIERRLKEALSIPVMHDDQHGTAVVVLAGLINSMKVVGKMLENTKIVIIGAGAAGVAIAKLLNEYAHPDIVAVDSKGIIHEGRTDLSDEKRYLAGLTKSPQADGSLYDALKDADIVIGVSKPQMITADDIRVMADKPVVFALANPIPEILPEEAKAAGAAVVATGRSDFSNQVNNALAFPGMFRGALDRAVRDITDEHKMKAAEAIAAFVSEPTPDLVIPSIFEKELVERIAATIN
jgi:malate dehydrogenase (oxaloacetate-decarboxylating)